MQESIRPNRLLRTMPVATALVFAAACTEAGPPTAAGSCGAASTPVHAVQGREEASPMVGSEVVVEGVVVADFANGIEGELGGFFLQGPASRADDDPRTSEGLFVFAPDASVDVSDRVRITGRVREASGLTQVAAGEVAVCGEGELPAPVALRLPVDRPGGLESLEGMAVVLPQRLVVSDHYDLVRFGQFTLSAGRQLQPTQVAAPGAAAAARQTANERARIIVDDGRAGSNLRPFVRGRDGERPLSAANPVRTGYHVSDLAGVVNFAFGDYRIEPTASIRFDASGNPRREQPDVAAAPLRVASLNVLNHFTTLDGPGASCGPTGDAGCRGADSAPERDRQRDKLVAAIRALDAGIVALVELENNAGASLASIVDALNQGMDARVFDFVDTGVIGDDAIKVGLVFRADRAVPRGGFAVLDAGVDPRFDSGLNRPALAQAFEHPATGEVLSVVVNHFKSKGCRNATGAERDQGDGQGCYNAARRRAAAALADWIRQDPTGSGDPDVLVLGDLNAYAMEDPIVALGRAGMIDLVRRHRPEGARYTYVYRGAAGSLDYALATPALAARVVDAGVWHANSDEIARFDYNLEPLSGDGGAPKPADFYHPGPYRASDHDPVVVAIDPGAAAGSR